MKKLPAMILIAGILFFSCRQNPAPDMTGQIRANLVTHLARIDSTVQLDSLVLQRTDSIDEQLERKIDDTLYRQSLGRVRRQWANAVKEKKPDSVSFYQGELDYMIPHADSITRLIATGDSVKKLGIVGAYRVQLRRRQASGEGTLYYFLDKSGRIWNAEMVDSSLATIVRTLK